MGYGNENNEEMTRRGHSKEMKAQKKEITDKMRRNSATGEEMKNCSANEKMRSRTKNTNIIQKDVKCNAETQ